MLQDIKHRRIRIGEIFKYAGEIYRTNLKWIVIITIGVYLPLYIIVTLLPPPPALPYPLEIPLNGVLDSSIIPYEWYLSVLAVSMLFTPLATAAVTHIAHENAEGRKATLPGILDTSLIKWGKLVVTTLLYMLIVGFGFILVVPGIYFSVVFSFHSNVVATQDKWGLSALVQSRRIVKGRWWAAFGFVILVAVMLSVVSLGVNTVFALLGIGTGAVSSIVTSVLLEILLIYFQIATALWYLNHYYMYGADA